MDNFIKQFLAVVFIGMIMTFALYAGLKVGDLNASSLDPYYGWVCSEEPGQCDLNWNQTECTWGPSGCRTEPVKEIPGTL